MEIPYIEVQEVLLGWEQGRSKAIPEALRDLLHKYDRTRLVNVASFAKLAKNVHPETVRYWIKTGRIKATNLYPNSLRPTYRIEVGELEKVLKKKDRLPE